MGCSEWFREELDAVSLKAVIFCLDLNSLVSFLELRPPDAISGLRKNARNGRGKAMEASELKTAILALELNGLGSFLNPGGRKQFLAFERVLGMPSGREWKHRA